MEKYKIGDKVLVLGKVESSTYRKFRVSLPNECGGTVKFLEESEILGKLEDFTPAEEKIKMTVEEKKEFDELKRAFVSLYGAFDEITTTSIYGNLYNHLFHNTHIEDNNKAQLEFSRAWDKPKLIEVEREFKPGDLVRVNNFGEKAIILSTTPSVDDLQDENLVKIAYTDGSSEWIVKDRLEFIKSNVISWGEEK